MTNPDLLTKKTARNLAGSASVGVLDTAHDEEPVPIGDLQLGSTSFYNDDNISAFSPETGSVKFNSSLQGESPKYFGKRLFAPENTDWNRIGHGGSTHQDAGIDNKDHYRSVYRDRFDDMVYEPSKVPNTLTPLLTYSLTHTYSLTPRPLPVPPASVKAVSNGIKRSINVLKGTHVRKPTWKSRPQD